MGGDTINDGIDMDFDKFWEIYPKNKRKSGKSDCKNIFRSIVCGKIRGISANPEDILIGVTRYAEMAKTGAFDDRKTGEANAFVPAPARWLRRGMWENDHLVVEKVRAQSNTDAAFARLQERMEIHDR